MPKVIALQGLPGSGKSTWAREYVRQNPRWARINWDDLRSMLFDRPDISKPDEWLMQHISFRIAANCIADGFSVIIDNTNANPRTLERWKNFSLAHECEFEVKRFDADIETCIARDAARQSPVGEEVIRRMAHLTNWR